ncbi:hypothetical protein ACIGNX_12100 [Actinosynnema sp. NPDC053489]|uniref:hypothetical protein n=1 Tax=Actinosynnema sp. NPDC053489 TaxID=3363916 RepID=UPI0037C505DE
MTDVLLRLRPIVHATPTATGLHVRGWRSSFSLDGGKGLWTIWERLAGPLADGVPPERLAVPENASPAVARALELLIGQLHEHDMLVEVPASWGGDGPPGDIASWLESVAARPVEAWRRLRSAVVVVTGEGALAGHARRALAASGLDAVVRPGPGLLVEAGGHAVAAGCAADVGFVVAPGGVAEVSADAVAVAARLAGAPGEPPEVLAALVASAAAHRLVCAVGGMPDPSTEVVDMWSDVPAAGPPHQAVLVARVDPLRAEYHPWLSAVRPREPNGTLVEVLGDRELGPVPTPLPGELPQLPVKLAASGDVVGCGTTEHAARLDALLRAARSLAPGGAVLGADRVHALGLALRTAVRHLPGTPVAEESWAGDPTARRWWKAVVLRFALPAEVEVTRLGPRVVRAVVRVAGEELSWAVEAEPADAVAFAALAAAGRAQAEGAQARRTQAEVAQAATGAGRHPVVAAEPAVLCGAAPVAEPDGAAAPWTGRDWHWPYGLRAGEEEFQRHLRGLAAEVEPVALGPVLEAAGLVGFSVGGGR